MARTVKTHFSMIWRKGGDCTITGTLCNRMSNADDDLNVTSDRAEVSCKFCQRLLVAPWMQKKIAAQAEFA